MVQSTELSGQHAVVTGAGAGIGLAIARSLSAAGCAVTLMGRRLEPLMAAAAGLPSARAIACDVSDEESVATAFAQAAEWAPIDILVNNAGAAVTAPLARTTLDQMRSMLDVNLIGPFLCCRAVLPAMQKRGGGRIITIASTSGLKGYAYTGAYCASKHAVIGMTRTLALELAGTNITANAVCPGFTDTELVARSIETITSKTGRSADEALAELVKHNPQKRLIDPHEVAQAVLWLCAPEARSITGQAWVVAGGEIMGAG
jgi:NAD(P)-dependent dehydrogenase (short-subunit alcohol dehydrogenase family)